jgi:L-fuculose-phosphate aldolase
MRGHGITTCGATVEETTLTAIRLNELAEINYRAYLLGDPQPISDEDSRFFDELDEGSPLPYWRYYCRLVGEA